MKNMNGDADILKILEGNPFRNVVEGWRQKCDKYHSQLGGGLPLFVLPSDINRVNVFTDIKCRGENRKDYKILTHLLPQPFLGHPTAPIWILMMNPGYSPRDEYDLLDTREDYRIKALENRNPADYQFPDEPQLTEQLKWRQSLVLQQLSFGNELNTLYLLNDRFDTISRRDGRQANVGGGGYSYWMGHLFGRGENYFMSWCANDAESTVDEVAYEKVFILEMMPYHSSKFDNAFLTDPRFSWSESEYFHFWRSLLYYGVTHEKVFLVRSPNKIIQQMTAGKDAWPLRDVCEKVSGRFLTLANPQGGRYNMDGLVVYLPLGDLMNGSLDRNKIRGNIEHTAEVLGKIIPNRWDEAWRRNFTEE